MEVRTLCLVDYCSASSEPIEYHGVTRSRDRFKAKLAVAGEDYYIGFYQTALEAAKAYDIAVIGFNVWQSSWSGLSKLNFPPNSFTKEEIEKVKRDMKDRYGDDLPSWFFGVYISDTGFGAFLDMELEIVHLGTYATVEHAARARDLAGIANGKWKHGEDIMNFPDMEYTKQELDIWIDWLTQRGERKGRERLPEGLPNNRNSYWSVRALVNQCFVPKVGMNNQGEALPKAHTLDTTGGTRRSYCGDQSGDRTGNKDRKGSAHSVNARGRKRKITVITEDGLGKSY